MPDTPGQYELPPLIEQRLRPSWPTGVAAQHILLRQFRVLLSHRQAVLDNTDPEGVHKIRVAARRARTALRTFAGLWPRKTVKRFNRDLSQFAAEFNRARDLDVLAAFLRAQLEDAVSAERRTGLEQALAQVVAERQAEQEQLGQSLEWLETSGFCRDFVAVFAAQPYDLCQWESGDG